MNLAPIAIFAYNRPLVFKKMLHSLSQNILANESEIFIFCDGAKENESEENIKNIKLVRELANKQTWSKNLTVIESPQNKGLAKSITEGVTQIVNKYGTIIVMEDDLVSSPYTLRYFNEGLKKYSLNENVASIHAYNYPIKSLQSDPETFFIKGADCWGWATWARAWKYYTNDPQYLYNQLTKNKLEFEFDFEGGYDYMKLLDNTIKNNKSSWAINWYASSFINNMLTLYPKQSLIKNIGDVGTNFDSLNATFLGEEINNDKICCYPNEVIENKGMKRKMIKHFQEHKHKKPLIFNKIINKISNHLKAHLRN